MSLSSGSTVTLGELVAASSIRPREVLCGEHSGGLCTGTKLKSGVGQAPQNLGGVPVGLGCLHQPRKGGQAVPGRRSVRAAWRSVPVRPSHPPRPLCPLRQTARPITTQRLVQFIASFRKSGFPLSVLAVQVKGRVGRAGHRARPRQLQLVPWEE